MRSVTTRILAAWLLITITGCTGYGVTFQSAPSTVLSSCHPALVGNWQVIEGERNAPASSTQDFLSVNDDCSSIYSISIKQEFGKQVTKVDDLKNSKNQKIEFADDYVVVTPKESSFEITPEIKLPSGKIIFQINKGKDGVILRPADLDKTAHLIMQRKISGQIFIDRDNPDSQKASNIYVRGDAKQIATYLGTLDLYSDDRLLLIPTGPQEVKIIQKAIKGFRHDKQPK